MTRSAFLICVVALVCVARPARAGERGTASFALIVGVNRSVDKGVPSLHYADDDGARYFELLRSLGARGYLLTQMDANTRRLHARVSAESRAPSDEELTKVVRLLASDVRQARARGLQTVFYFAYAGHGNVVNDRGYIALSNARLTGERLKRDVLDKINADRSHLIIDACNSFYLAYSRGPGGKRRAISGFSRLRELFDERRVGLLLSTSSARESYEWEAYQSGVFSHEVRSGLYGAADANGDSQISYQELAAFVQQANRAVPNERYRPTFFARAPKNGNVLVDLRGKQRRLRVESARHGHYYLENEDGIRLADFNKARGYPLDVLLPASEGKIFVHYVAGGQEYEVPPAPDDVRLAALTPHAPRASPRGAAHVAFSKLFSLPFGPSVVDRYVPDAVAPDSTEDRGKSQESAEWRPYAGWSLVGLSAVAGGVGSYLLFDAQSQRESSSGISQRDVAARNDTIEKRRLQAAVVYGAGAAALTGGLILLLTGQDDAPVGVNAVPGGVAANYRTTF